MYYYPGFTANRDGTKLTAEITHNLTRATAWEAVMRIRCSKGLRISSFHGHFFNRSTDLLALPTCDPDKAFAVEIAHEENMVQSSVAYVQCALLYTNSIGERRIRWVNRWLSGCGTGGWGYPRTENTGACGTQSMANEQRLFQACTVFNL